MDRLGYLRFFKKEPKVIDGITYSFYCNTEKGSSWHKKYKKAQKNGVHLILPASPPTWMAAAYQHTFQSGSPLKIDQNSGISNPLTKSPGTCRGFYVLAS